ncbi:MAG: exosortase T [Gammaproteobacteria bacterium]
MSSTAVASGPTAKRPALDTTYTALILLGAALLALEPARWLFVTWTDPAYGSHGLWLGLAVAVLIAWSVSSPRARPAAPGRRRGLGLLAASAAVRLGGQLLGVNVLSALTLAVDCYAIGLLLGLDERRRAVSPAWLAALLALSLPLERVLQRVIGFPLQTIAADGACALLRLGPAGVECEGLRILLAGQDLLVDLPCSGARGLLLLGTLYIGLAAVTRPRPGAALAGALLTLLAAFAANVLRIIVLALGLANPAWLGGASVMAAPWHELIGLVCLAAGAVPVLGWALRLPGRSPAQHQPRLRRRSIGKRASPLRVILGCVFVAAAALITKLPASPVDVARAQSEPELPAYLAGDFRKPSALTPQEHDYFTRYGGGAVRATYGEHSLLIVQTSAPLRHLHAPDECLRGQGHEVRYVGRASGPVPTALYRSTDTDGHTWRVAVSFVSDRGQRTASVGHAVWLWLEDRNTTWTMVQRISAWDVSASSLVRFDAHVARALDLGPGDAIPEPVQDMSIAAL